MSHIHWIAAAPPCFAIGIAGCAPSAEDALSTAVSEINAPPPIATAGLGHTCAAGPSGIQCWGANSTGQLGDSSTTRRIQPVPVMQITFGTTRIAAGGQHTCAIVNGGAKCWGANSFGQLGNGMPGNDTTIVPDSHVPVGIDSLSSGIQAIAAGDSHGCAVVNGAAKCWGVNNFGQVGDKSLQLRRSRRGSTTCPAASRRSPRAGHTAARSSTAPPCAGA